MVEPPVKWLEKNDDPAWSSEYPGGVLVDKVESALFKSINIRREGQNGHVQHQDNLETQIYN
jgi:hypothetical protein